MAVPYNIMYKGILTQKRIFLGMSAKSTQIRQRIREGRGIKRLVPKAVEAMIRKNGYYA